MSRSLLPALLAAAVASAIGACSVPQSDERFVATTPDEASFRPVADLLDHRCGSLDCHGVRERNLRLYGYEGLRLPLDDGGVVRPSSKPSTTDAEYHEDFVSVVGLEPEIMSAVVADHGANPERLTIVRKARGLEDHKGGSLMQAGDDEDRCLTSWLAGATDVATCVKARTEAF